MSKPSPRPDPTSPTAVPPAGARGAPSLARDNVALGTRSMPEQAPMAFLLPVPIFVVLFLVLGASGVPQVMAAVAASIAANILIFAGAHFVWTPLLRRSGLWRSGLLLGCALVAAGLAAAVARMKWSDYRGMGEVSLKAAIACLLFSWTLAALRGAQKGKTPDPALSSGATPVRPEPRLP